MLTGFLFTLLVAGNLVTTEASVVAVAQVHPVDRTQYYALTIPAQSGTPSDKVVRRVELELNIDLEPGTTIELWSTEEVGLPWDTGSGSLIGLWTTDTRTDDLVWFELPSSAFDDQALWLRLGQEGEEVRLTTELVTLARTKTLYAPKRDRENRH